MNKIEEAAELLKRPYGWCKGQARKPRPNRDDYSYCLLGSLEEVYGFNAGQGQYNREGYIRARNVVASVISEQYPALQSSGMGIIPNFNDARGRKKAEIVQVMEKAALKLDEQV